MDAGVGTGTGVAAGTGAEAVCLVCAVAVAAAVLLVLLVTVGMQLSENKVPIPASILVLGIFRDEGHIVREWLNHFAGQGVARVLLIDNGSTDGYEPKVQSYVDTGFLTVVKDATPHAQRQLYNKYATPLLGTVEWVVVCDLDEFVFGTQAPLASALAKVPPSTGLIKMEWVMFGSSGRVAQPSSVLHSFTSRVRYPSDIRPFANAKYIVRSRALLQGGLDLHTATLKKHPGWKTVHYGVGRTEESLLREPFRVNHYPVQSLSWFQKVKMQRPSASGAGNDNVRTMDYFRFYDRNEVTDTAILSAMET